TFSDLAMKPDLFFLLKLQVLYLVAPFSCFLSILSELILLLPIQNCLLFVLLFTGNRPFLF
ncbi:MAG: hypothetical protein ACK56I_34105, partial [bacterium]